MLKNTALYVQIDLYISLAYKVFNTSVSELPSLHQAQ